MSNFTIFNINLINLETGKDIPRQDILMKGGKIISIEDSNKKSDLSNIRYIDGTNCWVIPGLIDSHVHFTEEGNPALNELRKDIHHEQMDTIYTRCVYNLRSAITSGIIGVRDLGCSGHTRFVSIKVKERIERIRGCFPSIATSGPAIVSPCGHHEDFSIEIKDVDRCIVLIHKLANAGASMIKLINDFPVIFSPGQIKEMTKEAHKMKMSFSIHAFTPEGIENAVLGGADTIEHASPLSDYLLELIKKNHVTLIPTLYCSEITCEYDYRCLTPAKYMQSFLEWRDSLRKNLPNAFANGINILAGTDAGIPPSSFSDIHKELISYTNLGISPLDALKTATVNYSKIKNVSNNDPLKKHSTDLKKGGLANFIILSENPLENISNTSKINNIIFNGRPLMHYRY